MDAVMAAGMQQHENNRPPPRRDAQESSQAQQQRSSSLFDSLFASSGGRGGNPPAFARCDDPLSTEQLKAREDEIRSSGGRPGDEECITVHVEVRIILFVH